MVGSYKELKQRWQHDSRVLSHHNTGHEAFLSIIEMGEAVVPSILRDIEQAPDWIVIALQRILGRGPTLDDVAGQLHPICQRWLAWAKEEGIKW